jgi:hypothetical protein
VWITIAHSRAAATWRTPWRVQLHCELEGGAVRQAWEAEAEAEAEPQPLAEEEAPPQDDDEHEHKAREEPRVPDLPVDADMDDEAELEAARKHRVTAMRIQLVSAPARAR